MEDVSHSGICVGERGHMTFSDSLKLLSDAKYELYGKLLQWSVSQGGPGLPVWSSAFYNLVTGCPAELTEDVDYLPDNWYWNIQCTVQ